MARRRGSTSAEEILARGVGGVSVPLPQRVDLEMLRLYDDGVSFKVIADKVGNASAGGVARRIGTLLKERGDAKGH